MIDLYVKFHKIREMGWIKSQRKGPGGIGYTFEQLLGKSEENFPIADYKGIEIKVKRKYSKGIIKLFSANPDNEVFAINRLYNTYGIHNINKEFFKTFMIDVSATEKSKLGKNYFQLRVNHNTKEVKLEIFDLSNNLIENNVSWSFQLIKERINIKLKDLAIIRADIKIENNQEYFNYYHISFYEIKGFNKFIKLIENGKIKILFNVSVYMDKKRYGQIYNHGTAFEINIKNINDLYNIKDFKKNN